MLPVETWYRFDIRGIDDLSNAILAADLDAVQMAGPHICGSLAFAARDGIVFSSGLIRGNALIRGALAEDAVTLGVVLQTGARSRFWLNEVRAGATGIVFPGAECEFLCRSSSFYVAATLTLQQLHREAVRHDLTVHRSLTRGTNLHSAPLGPPAIVWLTRHLGAIHGDVCAEAKKAKIGTVLLRSILAHYARPGPTANGRSGTPGSAQIVHDALGYIRANLTRPISIEALAEAVGTSRRSLYRAFSETLGDTPQNHVRRLRLHRIRKELMGNSQTTVAAAARHWGAGQDLGRLSRSYRDLFGENPSSTLASRRAIRSSEIWM